WQHSDPVIFVTAVPPRVSMSQITTLRWPFDRDVAFFAEHGVAAVGVSVRKLEAYGVTRGARLLREAGLAASCMTSSGFFPLEDARGTAEAVARTRDHLAVAADIGASCLFVLPGHPPARSWEESAARSRPILEELLDDAERLGVRLALEPVSQLRVDLGFLHSFGEALDFVDGTPSRWLGVVLELNNAWIERGLYDNMRHRRGRLPPRPVPAWRAGPPGPRRDGVLSQA